VPAKTAAPTARSSTPAAARPTSSRGREVGIDPFDDRVNPHGGGIAIGHPFGMTGLRIMSTLLNGLVSTGGRYGIESMCVGGGQGQAMVIERLV
jgi:acetyl-CoA C-acetyltransferase